MPLFASYREWLKVADTALPQNFLGYLVQLCLSPLRADPFTILPYDDPKELARCGQAGASRSFLQGELPEREGPRPEICKWMAPHRQITQLTGEDMHKALQTAVDELVAKYNSHVIVATSVLEKTGDAILLADHVTNPHAIAKNNKREVAHIHEGPGSGDHSLHMCLGPADCKEVITKKWGERMTLAGSLVPNEYLIVYTPRTTEEVAAVKRIVEAAIGFMAGVEGSAM